MEQITPPMGSFIETEDTVPTVSAEGISESDKWFVAIVKRNSEKVSRDSLNAEGYTAYVATQTMMRRYAKRRPKAVEYVRIPAKVFLRMESFPTGKALSNFYKDHPYISGFMLDHARSRVDTHAPDYAVIYEREMREMRSILNDRDHEVLFGYPDESYVVGGTVKAVNGLLRGQEGTLVSKDGKSYFCLMIKGLDWAKVQVSREDIVPA